MTFSHLLHLFPDQLFLIENLGFHLSDLLVFGYKLLVLDVQLLLKASDPLLQLRDLPHVVRVVVPLPLGNLGWRRIGC